MSRIFARPCLIALFAAALVCSGCQKSKVEAPAEKREISLRHYFSFSGPFAGTMHAISTDFNRANAGLNLRISPEDHESFKTNIRRDIRQGTPADIYSYWAGARVQSLVDKLAPIDDALPPAEMNRLFGASMVRSACTYNGRIYLLPVTQHYVGFFYNKKIFADHHLAPPKTWNEFLVLGEKLKAAGITPVALGSRAKWPAQFWFDYLLLRTAPVEYREKLMAGKASWTDPQVMHAFERWHGLVKTGMFNQDAGKLEFDSGAGLMVRNGQAAMTLMGTWITGYFSSIKVGWEEDKDYGFFPFPTIDPEIPPVALGPIDGLIIPKDAVNIESAKKVLQHFSGNNAQMAISQGMGALSPSLHVSKASYSPMKKAILADIAQTNAWAFNYDLATRPEQAEIGLQLFSDFMENPDQYKKLLQEAEKRMRELPPRQ
ncbi:multiple sugar transport system substrate-binding protein [Formivibrio citricus]|uniref:Multiple sugar transport system substrate-binding protein n=1 Tax=Formivibrio citricus TaxID=83765 RepID=A0A1I4UYA8_9NEIS|nr:ABC transporter substrate-binding protein [Formivibrio citricus]SFM93743.1 multiple sugar transport system substrate-binding protein [Formivibrio citricus]